ncbi:hypothetical protein F0562_009966 [Nyssa sinensis]|uniref:Uncharacterized protein n=1 Tax=Nyssa sinensis TaxID=561372 RepID=A0A5J4ZXJ7_9ASTE|nr:hypothetical protein F0562_009966 [Nyssa sinensis]
MVSTDCFKHDKDAMIQKLRDRAIQNPCCGQNAVIERKATVAPKSEITVYAIVTTIVGYEKSYKTFEASPLSNGTLKRRNEGLNWFEPPRKRRKARKHKLYNR